MKINAEARGGIVTTYLDMAYWLTFFLLVLLAGMSH